MSSTLNLYGKRHDGNPHGDVFTSHEVVLFMLDLAGYTSNRDLSKETILEPSCGEGDFLIEILNRINESSAIYGFNPEKVFNENVCACEIDKDKFNRCKTRLQTIIPGLSFENFKNDDFLLTKWPFEFDVIIGNPPYIRYENIPVTSRQTYHAKFKTFYYRPDLYVMFYEHSLNLLKNKGKHCFICSNRWLKNTYGKKLRSLIMQSYNIAYLINVEKLDAFKDSVLAYPVITVISNEKNNGNVKLATIDSTAELASRIHYTEKRYQPCGSWDDIFLKNQINSLATIEQQGFAIGIGVATGADRIFISDSFKGLIEDELLLPVICAKDLSGDKFNWSGKLLLNPYDSTGALVDLDKFPKAKRYLESHKTNLAERHIAKKGKSWYSLIDNIKQDLTLKPKILLPDISGNKTIFIDRGKYYPAHNIYYVSGANAENLELLAAILMSDFVRSQIESISNKMNGGFPRWQAQSIRKLKIPVVSEIDTVNRHSLHTAYKYRDFDMINKTVLKIIKSQQSRNGIPLQTETYQPSLFDF